MDTYLEEFSEQLETSFDPGSIFPAEKQESGWLTRLFSSKKTVKQQAERNEVKERLTTDRFYVTGELQ